MTGFEHGDFQSGGPHRAGFFWGRGFLTRCRLRRAAGPILMIIFQAVGAGCSPSSKSLVEWQTYSDGAVAEAAASQKPVVIDFYADWCVPCSDMERTTYADPRVAEALEPYVRLKADLTDMRSQENEAVIETFGLEGLPAVVFIGRDGSEIAEARMFGYVSPREFLKVLNSPVMQERARRISEA